MGSVGDCYANAMCESFNATLECELLVKHRFRDRREAEITIFRFIEGWYNPRRRHTSIGNISPMQFEQNVLEPDESRRMMSKLEPSTKPDQLQNACIGTGVFQWPNRIDDL